MNILYLAHRLPYPPNKGDKLRSFHQIEHLSRRHRVWCACFADEPADRSAPAGLREHCGELCVIPLHPRRALCRGLFQLLIDGTVTEGYYRDRRMEATLRDWTTRTRFDAVLAFSSSMAPYALQVAAPRRVLDLCDLDSRKWLAYARHINPLTGWLYRTEGRRLMEREFEWVRAFDVATVVTEVEAQDLRRLVDADNVYVVGNGVTLPSLRSCVRSGAMNRAATVRERTGSRRRSGADARFLTGAALIRLFTHVLRADAVPDEDEERLIGGASALHGSHGRRVDRRCRSNTPLVGFVGASDYFPNVDGVCWFADQVWGAVRKALPAARFQIVGHRPVRRVRRLGRIPGIEIVGAVADVHEWLRRFDVSVAPLRLARGVQNKVLEAMAAAKPVVLTPAAARGIDAHDARHFIVMEDAKDMAGAIVALLNDEHRRAKIGDAARAHVAAAYDWDTQMARLEELLRVPSRTLNVGTSAATVGPGATGGLPASA